MRYYIVKRKQSLPSVFSHNGKMLRDLVEIANSFNQYFIDIGPSLANETDSKHYFRDYLRTPSVNQLALRSIDESKIPQVIEHIGDTQRGISWSFRRFVLGSIAGASSLGLTST